MLKKVLILGHGDATQFIDVYNQYVEIFQRQGYHVTTAFLTGQPNPISHNRSLADQTIFLNFSSNYIRNLKIAAIKKVLSLCRAEQFQMVICHRYKPTFIMLLVAKFYKVPVLFSVMHELNAFKSIRRRLMVGLLAPKNMYFAGVSQAVTNDLRQKLWRINDDNIRTLYNMIDVEATEKLLLSREEARQTLGLKPNEIVFGNIARLAKNKDHGSLINAFAQVKVDYPNAKLIIMGDGSLQASLQHLCQQLGLQDVIFTGFLPQAVRFMRAFDCFVLTSTQEAFGRVLLEAMVARLPIIATQVNGIPEVVGDSGILVPPKHPQILAKSMKHIASISLDERSKSGDRCYERAVKHFSIPVFHKQFWSLPLLQPFKENASCT